MLDRQFIQKHVDPVDWPSLATCQTVHAPWDRKHDLRAAFLNLFSPDPALRKSGHGMLENNIVVQGYLYPAANEIMPVLCAAIRSSPEVATAEALDLLYELAMGHEETDEIAAFCRREVLSIKEQLVLIADLKPGEASTTAFDIISSLNGRDACLEEFLRTKFKVGRLTRFEERLREDGVFRDNT